MHVTTNDEQRRTTPEAAFGDMVRRVRQALGRSQEDLAEAMQSAGFKLHQTQISAIEKGTRPLRLNEVAALASVLDMDLSGAITASIRGTTEELLMSEQLAYARLLNLSKEIVQTQQQRDDSTRVLEALRAQYEVLEQEWQDIRTQMGARAPARWDQSRWDEASWATDVTVHKVIDRDDPIITERKRYRP